MSETDLQLLLQALDAIFGSSVIATLFNVGVALFFFSLFLLLTVGSVYYVTMAWAGYESSYDRGNDKKFKYDESRVFVAMQLALSELVDAVASLAATALSAGASVGATIAQNLVTFITLVVVFIAIIEWGTWHQVGFMSFGEFSNCFLAPVWRTFFVPVANLVALASGAVLPVVNFVRHLLVSISTETIIDSLACGADQAITLLVFASATLTAFALELERWLRAIATILDIAPNFFETGQLLGRTIASLDEFFFCACNSLTEIALRPLFQPFRTVAFAQFVNATLNAVPIIPLTIPLLPLPSVVFLTQGVARPINQTLAANEFVRGSFNSTFDTQTSALANGGMVLDEFGVALFNITLNIVRESISTCPSRPPWNVRKRCSDDDPQNTGTCGPFGLCFTDVVAERGCCVVPPQGNTPGRCTASDSRLFCSLDQGDFRLGLQCAQVGADCPQNNQFGCCLTGVLGNGSATLCTDDLTVDQCGLQQGALVVQRTCAQLPAGRCLSQAPLSIVQTTQFGCGNCTNEGTPCQCNVCACTYEVDATPADSNPTKIKAISACQSATQPDGGDPGNPEAVCRVPIALIKEQPPVPGLFTALAYAFDTAVVQPQKYVWNIVWNIDTVFSTRDGFLFWRINDTFGVSVRAANDALHAVFNWLSRLVIDIGETIITNNDDFVLRGAAPVPLGAKRPSQSRLESILSLEIKQRQQLDKVYATTDELIREAFLILSTVIRVAGDVIFAVVEFLISALEFLVDAFFGTLYFTVASVVDGGLPNIFAYPQILFGDAAPPGLSHTCVIPSGDPNFPTDFLFRARVTNESAITCSERGEIMQYCRFIFQRAISFEPIGRCDVDLIFNNTPSYIDVFEKQADICNLSQLCYANVTNCVPSLVPILDVPGAVNEYVVLMEKAVDIARALDPIVSVWCNIECSTAPELRNFFSGFFQPLIQLLIVPIDFVVHLDKIFTTTYFACLDIEGALNSLTESLSNFTDLFRLINRFVTGTSCAGGASPRDSRVLCSVALNIDSALDFFVELGMLIWHVIQMLIRITGGVYPDDVLLRSLSFDRVEIPIRNSVFGSFAIILQVIPRSVLCAGSLSATSGCCFATAPQFVGQQLCLPRQTNESCHTLIGSKFEFVPALVVQQPIAFNTTCAVASAERGVSCVSQVIDPNGPSDGLPDGTVPIMYGCCKAIASHPLPGQQDVANSCIDEAIQALECENDDDLFFANQQCSTAPGPICPPFGDVVQTVLAQAFSTITSDLIILVPRVVVEAILGAAELIIEESEEGFRDLIFGIVEPIFQTFSDVFRQAAIIANCAGSSTFANAFNLIAQFIEQELCFIVDFITDAILAVLFVFFGIIEAIFTQSTDLLQLGLQFIVRTITDFAFAVFTPTVVCGFQSFLCDFPGNDNNVNFAVNECRRYIFCAEPNVDFITQCSVLDPRCGDTPPFCMLTCQCVIDNPITSRDQVDCNGRCNENGNGTISRAGGFGTLGDASSNPFLALMSHESAVAAQLRKRSTVGDKPSGAFCGAYLATYGVEKARATDADSTARTCLEVMDEGDSFTAMLKAFDKDYARYYDAGAALWQVVSDKWTANAKGGQDFNLHNERSFTALAHSIHGVPFKPHSQRTLKDKRARAKAVRSLRETHQREVMTHAFTKMAEIVHHVRRGFANKEHRVLRDWAKAHFVQPDADHHMHTRSRPTGPMVRWKREPQGTLSAVQMRMLSVRVTAEATRNFANELGRAFQARVFGFVNNVQAQIERVNPTPGLRARRRLQRIAAGFSMLEPFRQRLSNAVRAGVSGGRSFKPLDTVGTVTNDTLAALSLSTCNATEQVCTDCVMLDNLIGAATTGAEALRVYYTNNQTGYASLVRRFVDVTDTTLVNPFGNDTYTTANKRVPWVFDRLLTVKWFWQFDYSEFLAILNGEGGTPPDFSGFVGQTQVLQARWAAEVGRNDFENDVLDLVYGTIEPVINAIERVVASSLSAVNSSTLLRLYEEYLECDYTGALLCQGRLGVGLFDAIANIVLFDTIVIVLVAAILPFGIGAVSSSFLFMLFLMLNYTLTMWLAYGASPLCTLPALFWGIRGVPACFPADLVTLFNELIPQCAVIPIVLIDPAALPVASTTICSTCGTVPNLLNCAPVAGFLNGLDNVFYTLTVLFGPEPNEVLNRVFGMFIPVVGTLASLYTPEYVEALGDRGAVCNRITFPNIAVLGLLLLVISAAIVVALSLIVLFLAAVAYAFLLVLYAANEMMRQIDEGFVQGTRVEKLKQE